MKVYNWRLNFIVVYKNPQKAFACREIVHNVMISAATLRRIDYAILTDTRAFHNASDNLNTEQRNRVVDLFYFRSSQHSRSSVKDFRQIIEGLFRDYDFWFEDDFEVRSLFYKTLKDFPFPKEYFRPRSYNCTEIHKGKQVFLAVPEAIYQKVLKLQEESLDN